MLYVKALAMIKNVIKPKNKTRWAGDLTIAMLSRLIDELPKSIQVVVVSPFHIIFHDLSCDIIICNIEIADNCLSATVEQNKLYPMFMLKAKILQALISTIYRSQVTVLPEDLYFNTILAMLVKGEDAIDLHERLILNNKTVRRAKKNNLKLVKAKEAKKEGKEND